MTRPRSHVPAGVGAVLAGGAGERMGRSKPAAELGGRPLISFPLAAVEQAGLEPIVVAKRSSPLPALDARLIFEPERPRHPLAGVVAALREAGGRVVVAACDMPFLTATLLGHLASLDAPLVVCEAAGRLQPLLGLYHPALAARLQAAAERGDPATEAVRALGPRIVGDDELSRFGSPERLLANVNTEAELKAAEASLARDRGTGSG